jgi:hypothetical protein
MKITSAKPLPGFLVELRFEDGTSGTANLSSLAGRGVFQAWLEQGLFDQVKINEEGALEWPGGIDLCADSLYLRVTGKTPEQLFPSLNRRLSHA